MWEAKVIVADADMDADADADAEVDEDSKHKATLDWGDLMMFLLLCFLIFSYYAYQTYLCFIWVQVRIAAASLSSLKTTLLTVV